MNLKQRGGRLARPKTRIKIKHLQWLTGDVGHPKLKSHLDGVLPLMRISDTWDEFRKHLSRAYPKHETTDLGFEIEVNDV